MLKRAIIIFGILLGNALAARPQVLAPPPTALRVAVATALLSAATADYATTHYAMSQGAREANPIFAPLLRREPLGFAAKFGVTGLLAWQADKALRQGSRKGVLAVVAINVGIGIWAAQHNMKVASRVRARNAARQQMLAQLGGR